MKISAIIPVKTFSKAKTRLHLADNIKNEICKLMLDEVLKTISSSIVDDVVIVSKDEYALKTGKKYGAIQIYDENENGVNNAIKLADSYLAQNNFDTSIVLPQDIPLIEKIDVDFLLKLQTERKYVLVVPSMRFDGTNALVRKPVNIMKTHYDEDSYKIHLTTARTYTKKTSLVLIRRIMMDIDNNEDLDFVQNHNEKPEFCEKLKKLISK